MVTVSIILVNYNGGQVVLDCLDSIRRHLHQISHEVIVVDNASTDDSANLIEEKFPEVRLLRLQQNRGFGAGNNQGAAISTGKYLLLLNTDTLLISDVLPHLVETIKQNSSIGIVAPQLLNPDQSLQLSTAKRIGIWGEYQALKQQRDYKNRRDQVVQQFSIAQEVDIVIGAALMIRRSLFEDLAGFDETFFMYFEESDLCERARAKGWKVVYDPTVALIHLGGYSVSKTSDRLQFAYRCSQLYYYQKHRPLWERFVLRFYLTVKFTRAWLKSRDSVNLKILRLALNLKP